MTPSYPHISTTTEIAAAQIAAGRQHTLRNSFCGFLIAWLWLVARIEPHLSLHKQRGFLASLFPRGGISRSVGVPCMRGRPGGPCEQCVCDAKCKRCNMHAHSSAFTMTITEHCVTAGQTGTSGSRLLPTFVNSCVPLSLCLIVKCPRRHACVKDARLAGMLAFCSYRHQLWNSVYLHLLAIVGHAYLGGSQSIF